MSNPNHKHKVLTDSKQIAALMKEAGCSDQRCAICGDRVQGAAGLLARPEVTPGPRSDEEAERIAAWLAATPRWMLVCARHATDIAGQEIAKPQVMRFVIAALFYRLFGHPTLGQCAGEELN